MRLTENHALSMHSKKYPVDFPSDHIFSGFQAELARVNVVLGANGAGKSTLLKRMYHRQVSDDLSNTVYIEGGRALNPAANLTDDADFHSVENAQKHYNTQLQSGLTHRLRSLFMLLRRKYDAEAIAYFKSVRQIKENNSCAEVPNPPETSFDRLFRMFMDIFPDITVSYDEKSSSLICCKGDQEYEPKNLSDGEKQCLCILADLIVTSHEQSLIVVDEPELNLHPTLAERLWSTIESYYPSSVFVYATHQLHFAAREGVDKVFVLEKNSATPLSLEHPFELERDRMRPFLGALPSVASTDKCLFVEGDQTSFDALFYKWLLKLPNLAIQPVGSCNEVLAAASRQDFWENISTGITLCGVIDRDFRSEKFLESVNGNTVLLKYHEAESYLCNPNLIVDLASSIGLVDNVPEPSEVDKKIRQICNEQILRVALRRVFASVSMSASFGISNSVTKNISFLQEAMNMVHREAEAYRESLGTKISGDLVSAQLKREYEFLEHVVNDGSIDECLRYFEGKTLLNRLVRLAGAPDALAALRSARRHINIEKFSGLVDLRSSLLSGLGG